MLFLPGCGICLLKNAKRPRAKGYTVPVVSEPRFFRQFFSINRYLSFAGELDAPADLLHPNGAAVLDHDPKFPVIQRTDHFDELLLRFGQLHILIVLHDFPSSKQKAAAVPNTAAAVFLRNTKAFLAHRAGAKKYDPVP